MGSSGDKPRKKKHPLPKVPEYEEPNDLPLPGVTAGGGVGTSGRGRFGHASDGRSGVREPGRGGRFLLKILGLSGKDRGPR
jgi:hypothetical protein